MRGGGSGFRGCRVLEFRDKQSRSLVFWAHRQLGGKVVVGFRAERLGVKARGLGFKV